MTFLQKCWNQVRSEASALPYRCGLTVVAFFEVAAHDIEAGALSIDWLEIPRENRWKQLAVS